MTMTDDTDTKFGAIAALAKEERLTHPDHDHWRTVDTALEALRLNVRGYLTAAASASAIGNTVEADKLRAGAARVVSEAHPIWLARLEAARAERARVTPTAAQMWERRCALAAGGAIGRPSRDAALVEAIRLAILRLDALKPKVSDGSEAAFLALCDDAESAAKAFMSTVGMSRRASKARARAEAAAEAVAAAKITVSADDVPPAEAA